MSDPFIFPVPPRTLVVEGMVFCTHCDAPADVAESRTDLFGGHYYHATCSAHALAPAKRFPFLTRIYEEVPAWPPGTSYWAERSGFGSETRTVAEAKAAVEIARLGKVAHSTGPGTTATRKHRAEHAVACEVCKVTGKKPGTKRKVCDACNGRGSVLQ